jgi:hypothetical protein
MSTCTGNTFETRERKKQRIEFGEKNYEDGMTTNTLLSGSLKEFGLVEVLQVMDMGAMTGALHLKQASGLSGILYFHQGKLANCVEFDPLALTIGDVLQQLGMARVEQIEQAFSQQLQDVVGKRIGERLIAMRVITRAQLEEALRKKAIWITRELGLWKEGTYEFMAASDIHKLLPYGEEPLDIEVTRMTMDMIRYADEWQELHHFLPQGVRTMLRMSPTIPRSIIFPARTVALVMFANRYQRVRRIANAMHTPEVEVAHELTRLIQQNLLVVVPPSAQPVPAPRRRNLFSLPDPAEKLRLENFALFDLLVRMEQAWESQRMPTDQLASLAEFVNWTMDALADACRANGTELDTNTLQFLLNREGLNTIGSYTFKVNQNHIDVGDFMTLSNNVLQADLKNAGIFYKQASTILLRILSSVFHSINARVANPRERMENQEVWEALFEQFALTS